MKFRIAFKTPFAVARGDADGGYDSRVDTDVPLPASSLKGVMRARAVELVGPHARILAEVFGATGSAAAWAWSDATLSAAKTVGGARIAVGEAGTVERGFLQVREQIFADIATFDVDPLFSIPAERAKDHALLLRASARAVVSLGGERRRGAGWVQITDLDTDDADAGWTDSDSQALLSLGDRT